ncbi:hypothetical protein [Dietzia sp. ANT_WB102]|uniref:hypothetical protein n=1 Tax=Dietzia sp. ANT_WB102 TaxID=2597345 RepID=UPI0011ED04F7|nr:hypothetical protein [Dietzia sp. ANT_WB102]KAA0916474.1 hypothetical protein FQ137_14735 [Dietzia sp. ANT_WB102]
MRALEPLHPKLRIAALTIVSTGAIARGAAYIERPNTGGLTHFIDTIVPLHVWAIVWIAAGITVFAGVWHRIVARYALAFVSMMWAIWGISYVTSTLFGDAHRGWVTGALMLNVAGLTIIIAALADTVGPPKYRWDE